MWQRSAPSNPITQIHQHNHSLGEDSPSDPPELQEEETLESQEEYPQEVAEEAEDAEEGEEGEGEEEDSLLQYQHSKQLPTEETNSLAIRHLYSQEIAQNQRRS